MESNQAPLRYGRSALPSELESRWLGGLDLNQRDPASKTGASPSQPPPNETWNTRLDSNQRLRRRGPRPDPLDHGCVVLPERIELSSADYRSAALPLSYGSEPWYGGEGSNLTASVCRTEALNQKATPAWLRGQDSNLRVSALTVRRLPNLATPEKLWSGTW